MNQILSVDNSSKTKAKKQKTMNNYPKNNGPIEISSIVKFFSIAILIFGVFMVGTGSYSMYREMTSSQSKSKPIIYVESIEETKILLRITHDSPLSKVTYQWNEEEVNEIPSNGKNSIEQQIELPEGTNALTVYAVDKNGQEIEYRKVYTIDKTIDISVEPDGNQLKILVDGKNELTYMTYRWDEEEETRIDINDTQTEQTIEIPLGLHTLTVIAVDENNKTETFEKEVNGVKKPKVEITVDEGGNFILKASDEKGIKKVEFIVDEQNQYLIDLERILPVEERKEFNYRFPVHEGENKLELIVYNEDDVTETSKVSITI